MIYLHFNKFPVLMENKSYNWCSYYYVLEVLQKQEKNTIMFYILILIVFCDYNIRIEQWIESDKNIHIGLDTTVKYIFKKNNPTKVKTNTIIFKNSDWTIDFLNLC